MGSLNGEDMTIHKAFFKEAAKLRGEKAKYFSILSSSTDIYSDKDIVYDTPEDIDIIFEEYPKPQTIKRIGWYVHDDKLPIIAFLPYEVNGLQKYCKLSLKDPINNEGYRDFLISNITSDYTLPGCWICKLAPLIQNTAQEVDPTKDYNFLNPDV